MLHQEDSWYSFLLEGHNAPGRLGWIEKPNDLIGIRTRDFPACDFYQNLVETILWNHVSFISKNKWYDGLIQIHM
jgi:hypothetical protein